MPYSLPSTERLKYHQPSLRFGTDKSVSCVRPLISWKMASRSGSWWAVTALLVGVLGLEVLHHFRGFLVAQPLVVVHEGVAVVRCVPRGPSGLRAAAAAAGVLSADAAAEVWVIDSIYKAIPLRAPAFATGV